MKTDITIVIPTFNRLDFLSKMLHSMPTKTEVLNIFVVDNGAYIDEEFKNEFKDVSFHSYSDILEPYSNWNRGIQLVKTKWFMIPSDDDLFFEDSFNKISEATCKYHDAGLIVFGHNIIDKNDKIQRYWKPKETTIYKAPEGYDFFRYGVDARFPGIIFNTDLVRKLGMFNEAYKYTAADSLLIQKCSLLKDTVLINDILGAYRVWPNNSTSTLCATTDWFTEINNWQNDIIDAISDKYSNNEVLNIKDEVIARNIIHAFSVMNKRGEGFKSKKRLLSQLKYPKHANIYTQLQLLKNLFL